MTPHDSDRQAAKQLAEEQERAAEAMADATIDEVNAMLRDGLCTVDAAERYVRDWNASGAHFCTATVHRFTSGYGRIILRDEGAR